ncbi:hypothetical protein A1O1_01386 [Capronia coronata CBS 617.96]|uniref:Cyclase n=1 Tax=Capronia coronata CBS 617.96 TaxID=1182541 RepID=W9Z2R5_9EURO|nr:uncharacterized protein A1O1_01386 [Capronia coronata CBS 617.96]EXJ96260.1 hypothetical protein A1O1_01386 [Capronia coronata CBS 617.96]
MADYSNIPDFDSLPPVKDMPQGCAWGVFDKDGKKDHLGCLNLLTPKVVQSAFKEARDGISISLNWPIGAINKPGFARKGLEHKVISFQEGPFGLWGFDDELEFNTQCSSQWDSLVHFAHQPTGLSYNGVQPTREALVQSFGQVDVDKALPTLNHWHDRGGLVGRGVLLDYRAYAEAKGIAYDCFDSHAITVQTLEDVARHQGTEFKFGDILIVRTGFTEDLGGASAEDQERMLGTHKAVGLKGNKETARWIWNHHFAAVAGDAIAFEVLPPVIEEEGDRTGTIAELVLHQYFLSLFGLNIGELWDLKALSAHCKNVGRYEFLLTSVPLNVPGGIGSPPNALAIF